MMLVNSHLLPCSVLAVGRESTGSRITCSCATNHIIMLCAISVCRYSEVVREDLAQNGLYPRCSVLDQAPRGLVLWRVVQTDWNHPHDHRQEEVPCCAGLEQRCQGGQLLAPAAQGEELQLFPSLCSQIADQWDFWPVGEIVRAEL